MKLILICMASIALILFGVFLIILTMKYGISRDAGLFNPLVLGIIGITIGFILLVMSFTIFNQAISLAGVI